MSRYDATTGTLFLENPTILDEIPFTPDKALQSILARFSPQGGQPVPSIDYEVSDRASHEQLPRRKNQSAKDPIWTDIMNELEAGNVVTIRYADQKERGTLARSVGRRAAHRGFRVDIRQGEGFISVAKADEDSEGPARRKRGEKNEVVY